MCRDQSVISVVAFMRRLLIYQLHFMRWIYVTVSTLWESCLFPYMPLNVFYLFIWSHIDCHQVIFFITHWYFYCSVTAIPLYYPLKQSGNPHQTIHSLEAEVLKQCSAFFSKTFEKWSLFLTPPQITWVHMWAGADLPNVSVVLLWTSPPE